MHVYIYIYMYMCIYIYICSTRAAAGTQVKIETSKVVYNAYHGLLISGGAERERGGARKRERERVNKPKRNRR